MRWLVPLCLALVACDAGPELPTAAENRDMDEAGALLDNADNSLSDIDPAELRNSSSAP